MIPVQTRILLLAVNAINDAPTSATNTVTTFENSDYTFVLGNFTYNDVEGDAFTQIETTTVPGAGTLWIDSDGDGVIDGGETVLAAGNTVVVADITGGLLKFKPVANENGAPYATFDFRVHDGTQFSAASYTMTIDVTAINSEPFFTVGANQTVNEDPGAQTVAGWATGISAGGADEGGQTLTFNLTNDNNALFSVQPAVSAAGVFNLYTCRQCKWYCQCHHLVNR